MNSILDTHGNEQDVFVPEISNKIKNNNSENWQKIIQSMINVVHAPQGTARRSGANSEYLFAGKTGTAQVIGIAQDEDYDKDEIAEEFHDHAWFIAFAPAENPVISLAVLVENGGSGSASAAPIARELFDHHFSKQSG